MKVRPSNTGDDDRDDDDDDLDEEEIDEETEELTEIQVLERKVAEARRRYPHLITCHELNLLNALHPPDPALRKSLSGGTRKERDLFSDLPDDDGPPSAEQ